jgi:hypothetical protein
MTAPSAVWRSGLYVCRIKDADPVTYNMALEILQDEVEHEEDLEALEEDIGLMPKRGRPKAHGALGLATARVEERNQVPDGEIRARAMLECPRWRCSRPGQSQLRSTH